MIITKNCQAILDVCIENDPDVPIWGYSKAFIAQKLNEKNAGLSTLDFFAARDQLVLDNCVKWGDKYQDTIILTEKGLHYKEYMRLEKNEQRKEQIKGAIFTVCVELLIAFVTFLFSFLATRGT